MNRVLTLGGVADSTSAQSSLLREPSTSLALQKATNQNHAQKFPISLSVLKLPTQTDLHPLHWGFQGRHLLAAALSEYGVRCSHSPRSSPGPMCHVALDHSVPDTRAQ